MDLHQVLIIEPARRAHPLLGPGSCGVRADESASRRYLYTRGGRRDGIVTRRRHRRVRADLNWTTGDVWSHIARHQLPDNPVYATVRARGAPGSAASPLSSTAATSTAAGLTWLHRGWPTLFEQPANLPASASSRSMTIDQSQALDLGKRHVPQARAMHKRREVATASSPVPGAHHDRRRGRPH
ncbi:hypothetical protein [Rhodococcus sp. NCIMB 12038]|uniref:hypothetical protein n=1 Tax=Rhodococcus sp. NCIMB 12038 TaxID=933800 RepID=UPI00211B61C3|nr:hypothetical protein [Rhodococcus sp. NCIMB 12038]